MKKPSARQILCSFAICEIAVACLMMHFFLRHGLPIGNAVQEQMQYIVENRVLWHIGWVTWNFAAAFLVVFAWLLYEKTARGGLEKLGLIIVLIGTVPDMRAEYLLSFVLYDLSVTTDVTEYLSVQYDALRLTGLYANGLYNIGGIILTVCLIRAKLKPAWVNYFGLVGWSVGMGLSAFVYLDAMKASELATALAMTLSLGYMAAVCFFYLGSNSSVTSQCSRPRTAALD